MNDELVDSRENPLGVIPIVHIPNRPVAGSPWGLSDVSDILPLNRLYNETATMIADIIDYHVSPVTIIVGAKASNLERGPKKVWAGLPKDANVFNLEGGTAALPVAMEFLATIKTAMHELTGVPETALGQVQAVSNTSGVALSINYFSALLADNLKKLQYGHGLRKINKFVLRTLFTFEPESLVYDPSTDGILEDPEIQPVELDPNDPLLYEVESVWPPPLPVDKLVLLNELQLKMVLGLESKRGALRLLGEEFPDEKLEQIFEEQRDEAKQEGALQLIRANIAAAIQEMTGILPENSGETQDQPQTKNADGSPAPPPPKPPLANPAMGLSSQEIQSLIPEIVAQAYGTKLPQRRVPGSQND